MVFRSYGAFGEWLTSSINISSLRDENPSGPVVYTLVFGDISSPQRIPLISEDPSLVTTIRPGASKA